MVKSKEPVVVANVLSGVLEKFGLQKGVEQHKSLIIWKRVVGKNIAKHTSPGWITNNILWVIVDDSVWRQELEFLKPQIIEKLNAHLDGVKIKGIKFTQKRSKS